MVSSRSDTGGQKLNQNRHERRSGMENYKELEMEVIEFEVDDVLEVVERSPEQVDVAYGEASK